jgi:hypothetical protein
MTRKQSFVDPGELAEIGDEVVYHGDHGNLVTGLVAERATSALSCTTRYRVVDFWSEAKDADAGRWIRQDELFHKVE